MPYRLKMSKIQSIIALRQQGWTLTRIARELGVHRQTVARYVRDHSESTEAPLGSEGPKSTKALTGSVDSKSTQAPRSPSSDDVGRSDCEPLREVIEKKLDQGLHAKRIHQDLVEEHGFAGSYWSVMRFVRRLGSVRELPFRRLECEAGEEGQVDNLRAAVTKADWYEPELHPKLRSFCEHYGVVILPTRPYMPRHKGKIESGVKYVKRNALKARSFGSLEEENDFLLRWERTIADTRIHGTIK